MSSRTSSRIFAVSPFQMSYGERAALHGIIADTRPRLAIELGTAEGGSLTLLAEYAEEVHSFDLVRPVLPVLELDHVHVHTGDNHELLPELLREFEAVGRHVDFALVDGDHSAGGVRQDLDDLLASPACRTTVIVMHDTSSPEVRQGLDAVGLDDHPKVGFVDLDLVTGLLFRDRWPGEIWGGLGVVILGQADVARDDSYHRPSELLTFAQGQWYRGAASVDRIAGLDASLLAGIPSQTTEDDRKSLLAIHAATAEAVGSFRFLEIGSHLGGSLQALVADPRCVEITSIDPRPASQPDDCGEVFHYPDNRTDRMLELLAAVPGADLAKLTTIESSVDAVDPAGLTRPDVCFVDGEHTARAVGADAAFCVEVLRGEGIIVFHDRSIIEPAIRAFVAALDQPYRAYPLASDLFALELGRTSLLGSPLVHARLEQPPELG